jgi:GT2 family glycosyltransferase
MLDLSVIIVSWNTREMLRNCLSSLTMNGEETAKEIIVVDNDSADESRDMVKNEFPEVKLINSGKNLGFGKANNLGVNIAEGKYVLFINPDTVVLGKAIEKMAEFMDEHEDIGALGCKMIYPDGEIQPLGLQWYPTPITELVNLLFISSSTIKYLKHCLPYVDPRKSGYVIKLYGGCLMVRKTVLDRVGCFDERFFMYGEDVDLCRRINDAGYKLYYLSESEIIHYCGGASKKAVSNFSTLVMCDSISKLIEKYNGSTGRLLYRAAILSGSIARLIPLLAMKAGSAIFSDGLSGKYSNSISKFMTMIKWSINLERPAIPS